MFDSSIRACGYGSFWHVPATSGLGLDRLRNQVRDPIAKPVRLTPPVVLTRVRIEEPEADPHVPFARALTHHQNADVLGRGGRREQRQVERSGVVRRRPGRQRARRDGGGRMKIIIIIEEHVLDPAV
jgi:hypothetical protein